MAESAACGNPSCGGWQGILLAAASVAVWDYVVVLTTITIILLYRVLDFHIIGDILSGWRGDNINLYYNPSSRVSVQLLAKCEVLKQRYWPTAWLCSPHLQTLFLHFFGRSPRVDYWRQLYITSDGGTIALDWVKSPTTTEDGRGEDRQKNAELDETPTAIIVPGLTSDATNHYVKHVAGSFANAGWRVLVANHRGLGGVSITSNQFYNAGWTEDLRNIILLVQKKYPKSPLLAVGTSIGANIVVKYLGEEGPRTPLGGAVAICCPWDLLVCDRFMQRNGVQTLYNKALATGLQEYALLHQTALSRMVDWSLLIKSASIRDFDDNCTRHVGKYETVDTYYRRCSSAQFVEGVAVPLLCVSAEDDPICTKEAIPYDECRVNPNVILAVSRHGGHLAYFEGFHATSIWWVRAATEFARVLRSSPFFHQQSEVGEVGAMRQGTYIDKGPFLTMTEELTVAAQKSGCDEDVATKAQENQESSEHENGDSENIPTVDQGQYVLGDTADDVNKVVSDPFGGPLYRPSVERFQTDSGKDDDIQEGPVTTKEPGNLPTSHMQLGDQSSVTLQLRSLSEVAALRSALAQLLEQVPVLEESLLKGLGTARSSRQMSCRQSQTIDIPITSSVVTGFAKCTEATKDLLVNTATKGKSTANPLAGHIKEVSVRSKEEEVSKRPILAKDLAGLASQNRRTLWLLTYVALVTTFPLLGSALLVRTRGKIFDILSRKWLKRTP